VERGKIAQIYINGLGPVVGAPPASGEPAPATRLIRTRDIPTVTIGGKTAVVDFSGLAPTLIGVYQMNAYVPADIDPGPQPISVTAGGIVSQTSSMYVK